MAYVCVWVLQETREHDVAFAALQRAIAVERGLGQKGTLHPFAVLAEPVAKAEMRKGGIPTHPKPYVSSGSSGGRRELRDVQFGEQDEWGPVTVVTSSLFHEFSGDIQGIENDERGVEKFGLNDIAWYN